MNPVSTIATANTGGINENLSAGQTSVWLDHAINSASNIHIHLSGTFAATVNSISLTFYRISDLLRPAESEPYDGALCSICLDDFQNFVGAAFLPGCKKPTWLHPDCLSQHIQSRIADPITEAEINGVGIACPKCYGSESHDMPVKKLGHLISSPESQQRLQDFHLQSQFRIFCRDPLSPLLDPVLFKNATCPDCQHSYFVNLREPDQIIIQCTGLQVVPIDPSDNLGVEVEAVPCTRVFCASCEASPHNGMSCLVANRSPGQRLIDLNATLDAYRQAKKDDRYF